MTTAKYVTDNRVMTAPKYVPGRPPTRREVWDYHWHLYHDFKPRDVIAVMARESWAGTYVFWFNFKDWRKQPDWVEGDPVIPEAVPERIFWLSDFGENQRIIYACLERAGRRAA